MYNPRLYKKINLKMLLRNEELDKTKTWQTNLLNSRLQMFGRVLEMALIKPCNPTVKASVPQSRVVILKPRAMSTLKQMPVETERLTFSIQHRHI